MGETEEKEDHNVYLRVSTWKQLDAIAESENKSRNQVIRDILRIELEKSEVKQDGMQ
jgi:metal-responsive CopG/Arc/MetJ family transcriptional regulator